MSIKKQYIVPSSTIETISIEAAMLTESNVSAGDNNDLDNRGDGEHNDTRPRGTGYTRERTFRDQGFGSLW